jgi:hypothetical protein
MEIDNIKKILEKRGKKGSKKRIEYLKLYLENLERKEKRDYGLEKDVKKLLVAELKENPVCAYHLGYDSLGEGIEPIYFWTLDYMRDTEPNGLGLEVVKTAEEFEASVSSGYFGDIGTRASVMQDRAMKILATINTVVRSMINLIYDLKEFEIRLQSYDDLHSTNPEKRKAGRLALKGVWMDQVDIKKGRGSINALATGQLDFITLRDAFIVVDSLKEIDKLDLNKRVKNILYRKLEEYLAWEEMSEKELRKRFSIEQAYLKTQVDSVRLYTRWLKPYLKAAHKLGMKEFNTPDIVAAFSNLQMELQLIGKKEIKPESINEAFRRAKLKRKVYSCLEITFNFRVVPQGLRTERGTQYIESGRTDMIFKGFVFDENELKLIEEQEVMEDFELLENLTNVSLTELQEDLDKYLRKPEVKEEKKASVIQTLGETFGVFKNVKKGFEDVFGPLKGIRKEFYLKKEGSSFVIKEIKKSAEEEAKKISYIAYDVYKKAHGMVTW